MRARRTSRDVGATSVEYGLILALVAVVIVSAVLVFGSSVNALFDRSQSSVGAVTNP